MKMSDRKRKILQIVVDEYINTAVPVSSKSIAEKHLTKISSATVRNELASLEELGYLTQFHTSGGRVPSPQAYRFYIEELMQKGDLSERDLDYIHEAFSHKSNEWSANCFLSSDEMCPMPALYDAATVVQLPYLA